MEEVDFRKYRNRVERERKEQAKFAKVDLILKLLPILDDINRTREITPAELAHTGWARGLIEKNLAAVLEEEGLSKIEAEGIDSHLTFILL